MINKNIKIFEASWSQDAEKIIEVRTEVFVKEQNVPEELEQDGKDSEMYHVLATESGKAVGTARMSRDGHIGRVAVLKSMRGRGIGAFLMNELERQAVVARIPFIHLNAQLHAKGFYTALGYVEEGQIFEEAGISHIHMKKKLSKSG